MCKHTTHAEGYREGMRTVCVCVMFIYIQMSTKLVCQSLAQERRRAWLSRSRRNPGQRIVSLCVVSQSAHTVFRSPVSTKIQIFLGRLFASMCFPQARTNVLRIFFSNYSCLLWIVKNLKKIWEKRGLCWFVVTFQSWRLIPWTLITDGKRVKKPFN
jgi:hypothetical protein